MHQETALTEGTLWRQARTIFGRVLDCEPTLRPQLLSELCGERQELRELLEVLVNRYETASSCVLRAMGAAIVEDEEVALPVGSSWMGRFLIRQELGRGGMSRVFLAEDLVLRQNVALKVLHRRLLDSELARDRFRREVARGREVAHPNVCRIYEWFEGDIEGTSLPFLTMEWVDGESLASCLEQDESWVRVHAAQILQQIAAGLSEIHRRGIVHLDLKPGNILIERTPAGQLRVVVADFGLAVLQQAQAEGGTPGYMAPEQLLGGAVSAATDIYALALIASALDPKSGGTRARAVQRALHVEPALRPASAGVFFDEWSGSVRRRHFLWSAAIALPALGAGVLWHVRPVASKRVRLAILPFEITRGSLAVVPSQAIELTAQTIQHLHSNQELDVAGFNSVMVIATKGMPPNIVGEKLAADILVQPTLTRSDQGWRVGVRVLEWRTGKVLASETVPVPRGKMAELPPRVAAAVVAALGIGEKLVRDSEGVVVDEEAYAAYLEGRHLWGKRTPHQLREAIQKFRLCLERAPNFGQAESGIADCYCALADQGEINPALVRQQTMRRARRAVELEPQQAATRASLGIALALFEYDLAAARAELEWAIRLDPGYAAAHQWLSAVHLKSGDWQGCLAEVDLAYENDRLAYPTLRAKSAMRYFLRDYEGAIKGFLELNRLTPGQQVTAEYLAECYARLGQAREARQYADQALQVSGRAAQTCIYASAAYTLSGDTTTGRRLAEEAAVRFGRKEYFQPIHLARVFAELNDLERVNHHLADCLQVRDTGLPMFWIHPSFDRLRGEPTIQSALAWAGPRYPNGAPPDVSRLKERTGPDSVRIRP